MTKPDNSKPQMSAAPVGPPPPAPAPGPASTSAPAPGGPPAGDPAASADTPAAGAPREQKSRDGLVIASIVIASAAVAVMCYAQLVLSLPISGAAGLVTLALLMLIHKQMQKSAQIAQLQAELAHSRSATRPRAMHRAPQAAPVTTSAEARIRELSRDIGNLVPRNEQGGASAVPGEPSLANTSIAAERIARTLQRKAPQPPVEGAPQPASAAEPAMQGPPVSKPDLAAPMSGAAQEAATREQWSFRPRSDAQASVQDTTSQADGPNAGAQGQIPPVVTTIEGDLELVQRKIKELADEVNAAEALRPKPQLVSTAPKGPPNALEDSIGALRAAAKNMRGRPSLGDFVPKLEVPAFAPEPAAPTEPKAPAADFGELVIPATAERIAGSDLAAPRRESGDFAPPSLELPLPDLGAMPSPSLPPRAASIAQAIDDDAMDVLLGPIVTLAQHSVSHYEMTANLRSATGESLEFNEDDFAAVGGERDSHFDIARFRRAAALSSRMDAREREGSLLTEVLGSSMTSRAFLEAFANAYEARQRIAAQLVLVFSQRAVDQFAPSTWQALSDMHAFGFRFALDKVQHMGTDFASLQRAGFRFIRLDAQILSGGMPTPERFVPAEELLQRAALAGLSIIAAGIEDAAMQKRLLDSGVQLGQGPLFGAPRQVNVDARATPTDHSAAA